jgi:hypothetical protein
MTKRFFAFASFVALLAGCASGGEYASRIADLDKGVAGAAACCSSLVQAMADSPPLALLTVSLDRSARHFDFGNGLAPFVSNTLRQDAKVIELQSPLMQLGWAYGGDGISRYVDVRVVFYSEDGQVLPTKVLDKSQAFTGGGGRSLVTYVSVPDRATHAVITTDPKRNGAFETGFIRNFASGPVTTASTQFFSFGGLHVMDYKLINYGTVVVRALPH